jgi:A/G-specific adenine glycosylase
MFTSLFKGNNYNVIKISKTYSQKLTHQTITGRFYHITIKNSKAPLKMYRLISAKELSLLPFPKFITSYLKD